jgi:hypothetical protein
MNTIPSTLAAAAELFLAMMSLLTRGGANVATQIAMLDFLPHEEFVLCHGNFLI